MSKDVESRVYTINLSKVMLAPRRRRTTRAINMIREFASRHMKAEEIKIDEELNSELWQRGIRNPPRKVRVKMTKDEDGVVIVAPYTEEVKEEVAEEKPAEAAAAPAAVTAATPEVTTPAQEAVAEEAAPKIEEKATEVVEPAEVVAEVAEEKEEEKVVLSEEDLADLIAEESGEKSTEEKPARRGRRKNQESE